MKNSIKLTMITCLLLSNIFSQEKGNGFGFTFNGGSSIMNLMMGDGGMTPTVYYMYNLPNGTIEPSLGYFSTSIFFISLFITDFIAIFSNISFRSSEYICPFKIKMILISLIMSE